MFLKWRTLRIKRRSFDVFCLVFFLCGHQSWKCVLGDVSYAHQLWVSLGNWFITTSAEDTRNGGIVESPPKWTKFRARIYNALPRYLSFLPSSGQIMASKLPVGQPPNHGWASESLLNAQKNAGWFIKWFIYHNYSTLPRISWKSGIPHYLSFLRIFTFSA